MLFLHDKTNHSSATYGVSQPGNTRSISTAGKIRTASREQGRSVPANLHGRPSATYLRNKTPLPCVLSSSCVILGGGSVPESTVSVSVPNLHTTTAYYVLCMAHSRHGRYRCYDNAVLLCAVVANPRSIPQRKPPSCARQRRRYCRCTST